MTILLYRRREIVKGTDSLRRFLAGMIADDSVITLRVRGVQSDCECSASVCCERCRIAHTVAMKIGGTMDTTLERKGFGFIGYLALNQHRDALRHLRIDPNDEIKIPSRFQLVIGTTRDGFPHLIGPIEGTLDDAMNRLLAIEHKPEPELADGVQKVNSFQELALLLATTVPTRVGLWNNRILIRTRATQQDTSIPIFEPSGDSEKDVPFFVKQVGHHMFNDFTYSVFYTKTSKPRQLNLWRLSSSRNLRKEADGEHHIHP